MFGQLTSAVDKYCDYNQKWVIAHNARTIWACKISEKFMVRFYIQRTGP